MIVLPPTLLHAVQSLKKGKVLESHRQMLEYLVFV